MSYTRCYNEVGDRVFYESKIQNILNLLMNNFILISHIHVHVITDDIDKELAHYG